MYNHATQTSLPFLSDAEKLKELQEENELLRGKIRGYLTLGNLFVEKKDECQALQEQNQALRKKLESLQNKSQSETSRMEKEQEKNQASPSKDQNKTSTPLPSIEKSQNRPADEHFPSYIHNSVTTPETSPSKEEQQPEQAFLNDKMPTQESLGYESHSGKNRSVRTSESTSSFERIDPSPSESFLEHIAGQTDSPQNLNRQLSTKVNYSSSGSLNLMEFPSMSESHRVISCPQEELFDPLTDRASPNEVHKDEETILSIKVSQVAVAMDLTTDGPAEKMRKFLEELVPEIEKQEEETHKYRTCNLALKEEVGHLKEEKFHLLQKIHQLEHQGPTPSLASSLSSQTQVLDWEQHRQTDRQKMENSMVVGRDQELEKLQRETQKWRDYFSQWTRDKEKLKAENEKLMSEISNFKTQDLKRQEEFDKILLNAKERTTEAEATREEMQQRLDREGLRVEALELEIQDLKENVNRLNREKSTLEAELNALKRTRNGIGMMEHTENRSIEELKNENDVLREQLTVFKEDFDRERSDRAHAQSAKDDLRKEVEGEHRKNRILQDKLKTTERQLRSTEKNVEQTMAENLQIRKENQRLKKELQHEKDWKAQQQYLQMMNRPPVAEYRNPYRTQPETDPMAQPVPPYMFQNAYSQNMPADYSRPQMTNKAQLCPEQLPGAWNCPECTYTNHPSRTVCEICGNIFSKEELQNFYHRNSNNSQPLMARGDSVTANGEDPPDLCTDSGLKAAAVNCH
ncbi:uncharacterized protein LOC111120077 [Crassostrea virginica]